MEKGFEDDFRMLCLVEKLGPEVFAEEKGSKTVCANVDLYSGLIYKMLGISPDLYTRCSPSAAFPAGAPPPHRGGRVRQPDHPPRLQVSGRAAEI